MPRLPADLDRLLHDLRGPLNAIGMHAEVLKRAVSGDPTTLESVKTIQQELERLAGMLAATMEIVALERYQTQRANLKTLAERALLETRVKDVNIVGEVWPDVQGDPDLLVHAIGHLVQNAIDATQAAQAAPSPPEVRTEIRDGMAALVVRDYGIGLRSTNPKALIRLRDSTKPGHQGVGLVMVERIARLHGGSLTFEAPGVGAQAVLLLPVSGS